jgi:hypothetical protein
MLMFLGSMVKDTKKNRKLGGGELAAGLEQQAKKNTKKMLTAL